MRSARIVVVESAVLAVLAAACGGATSDVQVSEAFSFVPAVDTTAAYFTVTNTGDADDVLLSASVDGFETVQIHDSVVEDGTAEMVEQTDGVPVPAGGSVTFEPGGLHVMLVGAEDPIAVGDEVTITLTFEEAGEVEITAPVQERDGADGPTMDMGTESMDMGTEG